VETTDQIDGNNFDDVATSLVMEAPNPDEAKVEAAEVSDDDQADVEDILDEEQDDVEAQADDQDEYDDEDLGEDYEEAEEGDAQEGLITVKVDGVEQSVTLDELKRGYSGQKYIQKGMAEAAEARKQVEQMAQQVAYERQQFLQTVQQFQNEGVPPIPEYPSEELRASDPLGYLEAEADYRKAVEKRQAWEAQVQQQSAEMQRMQQAQKEQILQAEVARFMEWVPEFADPEKREHFIKDTKESAERFYGITAERLGALQSADELRILSDALKYRKLQENKSKAQKKAEGARPVKPAAKRAAQAGKARRAKDAKASMAKAGDVNSVANWLLS
jgi:hypothetical protein